MFQRPNPSKYSRWRFWPLSRIFDNVFGRKEPVSVYFLFRLLFDLCSMMIIILPLMAFAVMHSCAYFTKLSTETSLPQIGLVSKAVTYIRSKNQVLLQVKSFWWLFLTYFFKFIAMNEIFMMPISVYLAFTGNGIFLPIMYYRFLLMRYCSERNPYK